ncbi:MAG: hypothetical protein MUF44_00270 [Hydrogenophaga sp.]|jgi:hypothetical protein|nr:hypothetical protein [Hydrogenophaga sp.]
MNAIDRPSLAEPVSGIFFAPPVLGPGPGVAQEAPLLRGSAGQAFDDPDRPMEKNKNSLGQNVTDQS